MSTSYSTPPPYPGVAPQVQMPGPHTQVQGLQPQVQYVVQQPQVQSYQVINERFPQRSAIILGILQAVIGSITLIINCVGIAMDISMAVVAHGIWGGIFFIITGVLGYVSGKYRKSSVIAGFLGMNIISTLAAVSGLALSCTGVAGDFERTSDCYYDHNWQWICIYSHYEAGIALNVVLVIAMVGEIVSSLWSSVICCASGACAHGCCGPNCEGCCNCCQPATMQPNIRYMVPSATGGQMIVTGHMMYGSNIQPIVVQNEYNLNGNNNTQGAESPENANQEVNDEQKNTS